MIDEICFVRSMTTEAINHDPAHMFMNTGSQIAGRPSWAPGSTYGLGSEAERPARFRRADVARPRRPEPADRRPAVVVAAFCPAGTRACTCAGKGDPVLYLSNPPGVVPRNSKRRRRRRSTPSMPGTDAVLHDPEIATRIAQYEMAFQMQASVPELMDDRR